jgi:hypothetical protein
MNGWKSIESAPKDGRALLLFARLKSNPDQVAYPVVGFWHDQIKRWKPFPELLNREEELIPSWWIGFPEPPA